MEAFDSPVLLLDPQGLVLGMNRAARAMVGPSRARRRGVFFGALLQLDDNDCARILQAQAGRQAGGLSAQSVICRLKNAPHWPLVIRSRPLARGRRQQAIVLVIENLRRWEQRYNDWLSGSPLFFFETDATGSFLYGAGPMAMALALPQAELEQSTFPELAASSPQAALLRDAWQKLLQGAPVKGLEIGLRNGRDAVQPFWVSLYPFKNETGQVIGVRGIASDLSAQKSLAHALEAAEERFAVLFRESSDPILMLTLEGEILLANPAFEKMAGLRSDQLFCGEKTWADFILPADLGPVRDCLQRCMRHEEPQVVEYRLRGVDGAAQWHEQTHSYLHDEQGREKGILAVARNIDRYKRRELALSEKAEAVRYRHARAQVLVGELKDLFNLTSVWPQSHAAFLNGVCDILHEVYHPQAVFIEVRQGPGTGFYTGRHPPPEGLAPPAPVGALVNEMLAQAAPLYRADLEPAGSAHAGPAADPPPVRTFLGAPLLDSAGRAWGALAMLDTKPLALDNMDVELLTIAALRVAARLRFDEQEMLRNELEEHLRQAQKMEAVGMLAGGIAHDFNNILSGILGFASHLLSRTDPAASIRRPLERIEQAALRGSDLTRQLLAFARRQTLTQQPVSLNQVIHDVFGILAHSLDKRIRLEADPDSRLPGILGDYGQMNQVLMNLCINSAEAMRDKGGVLAVKTEYRAMTDKERALLAKFKDLPACVCVEIRDTGCGMSADVRAHIFDPFFTTKSERGGSGLGLAIVYGIVSNHNGDIVCESTAGEGTVFRLYFPPCAHPVTPDLPAPAAATRAGTETILVIDDEEVVREMVCEIIKAQGYRVLSAASGEEGLEIFKQQPGGVDLVLLDMFMPGLDGEQTFTALRALDDKVRVLLSSGYARDEVCARMQERGALGLIQKPYKYDALLDALRDCIDTGRHPAGSGPAAGTSHGP